MTQSRKTLTCNQTLPTGAHPLIKHLEYLYYYSAISTVFESAKIKYILTGWNSGASILTYLLPPSQSKNKMNTSCPLH